jgi:hypothetical protein
VQEQASSEENRDKPSSFSYVLRLVASIFLSAAASSLSADILSFKKLPQSIGLIVASFASMLTILVVIMNGLSKRRFKESELKQQVRLAYLAALRGSVLNPEGGKHP